MTHMRDLSFGCIRDGLVLHDHMAEHVLSLAISATAHAVLVNVDMFGLTGLDVIHDSRHGAHDLVAHLVDGKLIVLKLEFSFSCFQLSVLLGRLKRKLLLQLLDLGLIDSLVHLHFLNLFLCIILEPVSLLLSGNLDVTPQFGVRLLLLSQLVIVVLSQFSLLNDQVRLTFEAVRLDTVLLTELGLHLREESMRTDRHIRDLDGLHPHTPAGKKLLHIILDAVTEHGSVLEDVIDRHIGNLVANERLSH